MNADHETPHQGPLHAYRSDSKLRLGLAMLVLIALVVSAVAALRSMG